MRVTITPYQGEESEALALIRAFWHCHSGAEQTPDEARADLAAWTAQGHRLYFINADGETAGFAHLGERGNQIDWLEDLFVLPRLQNRGIGTEAVRQLEAIVQRYSESLYIEAAARNARAIRLYHRLGYQCLNSVTLRRDFHPEKYPAVRKETLYDMPFEIRAPKALGGDGAARSADCNSNTNP